MGFPYTQCVLSFIPRLFSRQQNMLGLIYLEDLES